MNAIILMTLLMFGGLVTSLSAASVNDLCGTWRLSASSVDVLTVALAAVPADMPPAQAATVSDALRTRLGQIRWTVEPTQVSLSVPGFPATSQAVTISALSSSSFAVASSDATTGQPRLTSLMWIDHNRIEAGNLLSTLTGPARPAAAMPDNIALERVTP